jgi:FtsP/CotA-like multicopper oxidase with cupredoxin domain
MKKTFFFLTLIAALAIGLPLLANPGQTFSFLSTLTTSPVSRAVAQKTVSPKANETTVTSTPVNGVINPSASGFAKKAVPTITKGDAARGAKDFSLFAATDPTEIFLRADTTTLTMPDGRDVVMWGFAQDSAFGAEDGQVTVPGPAIMVETGNSNLRIHLDNNLPVPVSIVVSGHVERGGMTPVYMSDGRMRAFTHETPPGNTSPVDYRWNLRKGTYIYHSGSHPQMQVQMGLYGAVTRNHTFELAYPGTPAYTDEATLIFSEIDPDLHDAIAAGDYGPGLAVTSTIGYAPKYFLINGKPFSTDPGFDPEIPLGVIRERKLLRFINAGYKTHEPAILNVRMVQIAEDGNKVPFRKNRQALELEPMKTADFVVTPNVAGRYPIYDRRLFLSNGPDVAGGMLRYLTVVE